MQHPRAWRAVLLLTIMFHAGQSERYGCLFERKLCFRDQFCSNDGLFGQCHSSKQDRVQYQVTVPVLKRMQEVLKQLMLQGLSWQDDLTQYILSKELKRVPHVTQSSKPNSSSYSPSKQHISKSGSAAPAGNYVDYADPAQSPISMQAAYFNPYTYQQHRHQDEAESGLIGGGGYARPSVWSKANQRERERDRQLLQQALSTYLASAPSYRHRGPASLASASLPYYDDLQMEIPVDYAEDYTLEERLGSTNRQPPLQNKFSQVARTPSGNNDGLLQKMSGVLQRYGVEPKELSQEQLYKLALILQLLQAQDKTQDPDEKDLVTLKEMQLLKTDSMSRKPEKLVSVPIAPDAPQAPLPVSAVTMPTTKSIGPPLSASHTPLVVPEEGAGLKGEGIPQVEAVGDKEEYGYIVTNHSSLSLYDGVKLLELLAEKIHLTTSSFINLSVVGPALTFRIRQNELNMTAAEVAAKAVSEKNYLESETSLKILQTGVGERTNTQGFPQLARASASQSSSGTVITLVSMAVVGGVLILAVVIASLKHYAHQVANGKLGLGPEGGAETHFDYQDCVGAAGGGVAGSATSASGRRGTDTSRVSSVSSQFSDGPQHSPSSTHSSTPSWSEEPAQSNMDISTGHLILAYMEDHLRNKDRLQKEWEALCSYQADPCSVAAAQTPSNMAKNRQAESLPYDHSRVKLKRELNHRKQDYINASFIFDHDPRQPAYIATQGPLPQTVADFWQMVWENGCTVIVMMSALAEDGQKQSERYWPDEGSSLYHIYEVNLVSEHIWCKDFLVRSFYLKNVQTQETRTLTQFHLLSWPADGIPTSTRPLLDFRRKVNKCYRGRSCPIIVHCSDGTGRTGTYILIDMVLNRMAKGVKEIDIAATLEHIRDQRPGLVSTKDQFEFALTAVAEEVNAILKALPQ
ncbi:receptor-type tyrosine-protein phosphatase-like N isoform X2 [Corythoichthys intestinalis]|uniref:receptor-type tyrosine-protein phosphatase-like N isoform X2 n=1 Tax=Corythoichthys intestinalis TaxID=161448 RepID=UPI0025A5433B|nr:receptor-type tyrosine-protein phosphatase-like N isoform X2 [Corythoichthys intestinalis]XP_057709214.1 receptor-type tyrosine-protein phosphatase-like N isoform X2 [Corythoichthys intestinalis]